MVGKSDYYHALLAQISGFRNELTGTVIAKRLLTDFITPRDVEEKWQRISDPKELAVKPATTVHAVITLDIGDAGPGHGSVAFGIEAKDGLNVDASAGPRTRSHGNAQISQFGHSLRPFDPVWP